MRTPTTLALFLGLAALAMAPPLAAQTPTAGFDPQRVMRTFQDDNGPVWQVRFDRARGVPEHVFGGHLATSARPGDDTSFEQAAREAVDSLSGALGFRSEELVLVGIRHLALSRIGSSDKLSVKLRQLAGGLEVHGGVVHALFDANGDLLSLDNQAQPNVRDLDLSPDVSEAAALAAARADFRQQTGTDAQSSVLVDYVVWGPLADLRVAALPTGPAYVFQLQAPGNPSQGDVPFARRVLVAARGAPVVLESQSLVHTFDVAGNVKGWCQAGLLPDGVDPETLTNLADVRVSASSFPDVFTDTNGNFNIPGASGTINITATLDGIYSTVNNEDGPDISGSGSGSPSSNANLVLAAGLAETDVAQVNSHYHVGVMRDWLRSVDPTETTLDFPVVTDANQSSTCNATYDGVSINFRLAGDGCVNSAYASVVYHELGHWMNDLYGSGNNSFGIGEGGADIWALYVSGDPIIGPEWSGPGTNIRDAEDALTFCGDDNLGCYGESHANGEPLMAAFWAMRSQLDGAFGNGIDIAEVLMLSWYQAFDDKLVRTIVTEHLLVLDDDDADLSNGTPHFTQIDAGFQSQGFPAFQLPIFEFGNHPPLDLVRHDGPVLVTLEVTSSVATVDEVFVHWSTDGGQVFSSAAMSFLANDTWIGAIGASQSPEVVAYYFQAQDASNTSNLFPAGGASKAFVFDRGEREVHAFFDFEPVSDEGWTHNEIATQDDWNHDVPAGKSFDPNGAFSGSRVWGNDLGLGAFNGAYQPDVHNELLSPVFDLSGETNTRLRFRRWLSVEKSEFDFARVYVDGVQMWENPFAEQLVDDAWKFVDMDISAVADDDSSVQVRFELITDGGLELGGWTIDDFSIVSLTEALDTPMVMYGSGTAGTGGTPPVLDGAVQAVNGGPLSLDTTGGLPNAFGILFIGTQQASIPGLGGTFLVGDILEQIIVATDGSGGWGGSAVLPPDIEAASGSMLTFQYWHVDPQGPAGAAGTQGLSFTIP